MKVSNKTILVTGGGSGIGRELVLQLLEKGARVAAVDRDPTNLQGTQAAAGALSSRLSLHPADISQRTAIEALPAEIQAAHGQIDGIINCAGIIQPFVKVAELSYEQIERVMQVNFYGTLYVCKTFLPLLQQRPEAHIVNISSMGGFLPVPGQSIYGASKAAVKLLTEALYSELRDTQVRVSIVFPGAVATNITSNSGVENPGGAAANSKEAQKFKPLPAPEAAAKIIAGMEKDAFRILVGSDASFLDKFYRLSPQRAADFIAKKMAALLKR